MPVPVVIKLKLPLTAGSLLRIKSALVAVKLALQEVLTEVSVNPLVSVKATSPPPVKDRIKSAKLVFHAIALAALRRVIFALVAPRVRVRSVSSKSLALIINPAD